MQRASQATLCSPLKAGKKGLHKALDEAAGISVVEALLTDESLKTFEELCTRAHLTARTTGRIETAVVWSYMEENKLLFTEAMQNCRVFSICWDPGQHAGKELLGSIGLVGNTAAYGALVPLMKLPEGLTEHSDAKLDVLRRGLKLERQAAYMELVAVDLVMKHSFGCSLADFMPLEEHDLLRPLKAGEVRVSSEKGPGFAVWHSVRGYLGEELPSRPVKICVHITDQGSTGVSGLKFLEQHLQYWLLHFADPCHRTWTDMKNALKSSAGGFWHTFVALLTVFNLNYGPFRKSGFFEDKKAFFQSWYSSNGAGCEVFRKYAADIAGDHGLPPPESEADFQDLWKRVGQMQCCWTKRLM